MKLALLKKLFVRKEPQIRRSDGCTKDRTVLLVSPHASEQNTLRVAAILERWHLLIAPTVDCAERILEQEPVSVVLYDRRAAPSGWQPSVRRLLQSSHSVCLILLSDDVAEPPRCSVLECGGYDVARKPLDRATLVALVNGYLGLRESIDSFDRADSD